MEKTIKILNILKKSREYISGEELSNELNITREAVWKNISLLRRYGYVISAKKGKGYRLEKGTDLLLSWEIQDGLETKFIGRHIIHKMRIDSTQDLAIKYANKYEEGTVIIAEEQAKGRGRVGREWYSPKGGIWFSIILKPSIELTRITLLPLAVGLAIIDALATLNLTPKLKWPNDVMLDCKKVAGILLDMSSEMDRVNYVVVGVGINANMNIEEIKVYGDVTTLRHVIGHDIDRIQFMRMLLRCIEERYLEFIDNPSKIIDDYKARCITLNTRVRVKYLDEEFDGDAINIDDDGSLIVMLDNNTIRRIVAGEVSIR